MNKKFYCLISCCLLLFVTNCLNTEFEDPVTEFSMYASLQENSEPLRRGNDEVRVLNVRFLINDIALESSSGNKEQFESNPIYVNLSNFAIEQEVFLGSGEIFGGSYTGISFNLAIPDETSVQDEFFYDRDPTGHINNRYSVVIAGFYNNEDFTFRTSMTPNVTFGFDRNVNMPEKSGLLRLGLVAEWEYWFLSENNEELLNPMVSSDRRMIEENFKRYFTANVFTIGEL